MVELLRAVGVIIALVLAYTVLALVGEHFPASFGRAVPFLLPIIAFAAIAWLPWEARSARREHK